MAGAHQAGPDTVVHITYVLLDGEGEVVETSTEDDPMISFLFGYGQLAPALEQGISGLRAGDTKDIRLPPAEAFGQRVSEAILEVDRAEFGQDVSVGDEFQADDEQGDLVSLVVLEVLDDVVVLDANHPLAGQQVTVRVCVEAVRPASSAEIAAAVEELEFRESSNEPLLPGSRLVRRPLEHS